MRLTVAALLVLHTAGAAAQPAIQSLGMDGQTCAVWMRDRDRELAHAGELLWVLGYVSGGASATGRNFLVSIDERLVDTAMTVQCTNNLSETIPQAAASVMAGLRE